jgi:hypothetical protein
MKGTIACRERAVFTFGEGRDALVSALPVMAASDQARAKKLCPGCVRCSSDNRRNGDQAALTLRADFVAKVVDGFRKR